MAEPEIPKTKGSTLKIDPEKKKKKAHLGLSTGGHILMSIMYICHLHI